MGQGDGVLIASVLGVCCIAIFVFEVIKHIDPEITLDKLVAAGIGVLYLIGTCIGDGPCAVIGMAVCLLIPLGLIWFGDELGSVTGIKMGLVQRPSPGFMIKLIGWIGLMVPAGWVIHLWIARNLN